MSEITIVFLLGGEIGLTIGFIICHFIVKWRVKWAEDDIKIRDQLIYDLRTYHTRMQKQRRKEDEQ